MRSRRREDRGYVFRVVPPDRLQAHALAELVDNRLHGARGKKVNVGALKSTYGGGPDEGVPRCLGREGRPDRQAGDISRRPIVLASEVQSLASGDPDAWMFFDFQDTYARLANDLTNRKTSSSRRGRPSARTASRTRGWSRTRTSATGCAEWRSAPRGRAGGKGVRQALHRARTREAAELRRAEVRLRRALLPVGRRGGLDEGREDGGQDSRGERSPGHKFTWLQLDQAVKALEAGQDIDYQGASGPIDMNEDGDPTAGVYDVYEFKSGKMRFREQIAVPERAGGI